MANLKTHRFTVRVSDDEYEKLQYWRERKGFSSVNELMSYAVELMIRHENGDEDISTLQAARLNQLIGQMQALTYSVSNLEQVVTSGFDGLLSITRGENYLDKFDT